MVISFSAMDTDTTVSTESQDSSKTEGEENTEAQIAWADLDYDQTQDKAKEIEQKNKQLYARLKKAEEKAKTAKEEQKTPAVEQETVKPQTVGLTDSEIYHLTQGGSKSELDQIRAIMKGKGVTFEEAQADGLFVAYQQSEEAKKKAEAAQLGASGRTSAATKDSVSEPGLTREEHKARFHKRVAQT